MARIQARTQLNAMIEGGRLPLGTYITSQDAAATAVAAAAGCDFVIVDREHGPIDVSAALNHVRVAEANCCIPLVRVVTGAPECIQQSLDLGAHGVVVPRVETASAAQAAVTATRYAPGGRGRCSVVEAARWDTERWDEHRESSNRE